MAMKCANDRSGKRTGSFLLTLLGIKYPQQPFIRLIGN